MNPQNEIALARYEAEIEWRAGNVDIESESEHPEDYACWACTCDTCKG